MLIKWFEDDFSHHTAAAHFAVPHAAPLAQHHGALPLASEA